MNRTSATTGLPSLPTAEQLPDDPDTLQSMLLELLATLHQRERDNEALRHRVEQLLRRLYGPRSERFNPDQPLLFADLTETDNGAAASASTSPSAATAATKSRRRCRPHGRRRLPEHLPRQTVHHTLAEAARLCPGCGQRRQDIGVDKSEHLDYRPASLLVIEHWVHKYACPHCSRRQPVPGQDQEPATMPSPELPASESEPSAPPPHRPPSQSGRRRAPRSSLLRPSHRSRLPRDCQGRACWPT